jgi:FKBP-type peptidyl-prolyl cis-trans isomerase (trigger factor)
MIHGLYNKYPYLQNNYHSNRLIIRHYLYIFTHHIQNFYVILIAFTSILLILFLKNFMDKYTFKKEVKDSEITLTINIHPEKFLETKNKIYNKLSQDVTIQGFRPGKAPKALIESHISEKVYNQTINSLIPEVTSEIFVKENINPLTQVSYEIVKMSDAEGVEYKAKYIEYPVIKLGDFSKIKVEKVEKPITDEEINKQMRNLVNYYLKSKKTESEKDLPAKDKNDTKESKKPEEEVVITDELVKSLNIGFENVENLKVQIKKEIGNINIKETENKWLNEVLVQAVKLSKIEAPKALVLDSVSSREKEYNKKLEELNLKLEEFLKVQNTTMDKLKSEWEEESKKKLATELLLLEIIKQNKITVSPEEIEKEIANVTDPQAKTNLSTEEGRKYLVTMLLQEKAIDWLKKSIK